MIVFIFSGFINYMYRLDNQSGEAAYFANRI